MELSSPQFQAIETLFKADPKTLEGVFGVELAREVRCFVAEALIPSEDQDSTKDKKPTSFVVERARLQHALSVLISSHSIFPVEKRHPFWGKRNQLPITFDLFQSWGALPLEINVLERFFPHFKLVALLAKLKMNPNEAELSPEERRQLDVLRLIEKMEADYRQELSRLEFYDLFSSKSRIPTFSQILATFTAEDLLAVVDQKFQGPKLILLPPISFRVKTRKRSLERAMNQYKIMPEQEKVWIDAIYEVEHEKDRPKVWQAFMVEGASRIHPQEQGFGDDPGNYLRERLRHFKALYQNSLVQGMDRWRYAHLMMSGLMTGQPLDEDGDRFQTVTLLNEEEQILSRIHPPVPNAGWSSESKRVNFLKNNLLDCVGRAAFRRCVGGVVPSTISA